MKSCKSCFFLFFFYFYKFFVTLIRKPVKMQKKQKKTRFATLSDICRENLISSANLGFFGVFCIFTGLCNNSHVMTSSTEAVMFCFSNKVVVLKQRVFD